MNRIQIRIIASIMLISGTIYGEPPAITQYAQDGRLTFQTSPGASAFSLQFSGSPGGPWQDWGDIVGQPITGQVMSIYTPLYFRVSELQNDAVNDSSFKTFLIGQGWDLNQDGRLTFNELSNATEFKADGNNNPLGFSEADFSGFTNLTWIQVGLAKNLTNVCLANLSNLQYLNLSSCKLMTLDISSHYKLKRLYVGYNKLINLNISANTNLTEVSAYENPLQEIIVWWDTNNPPPISLQYTVRIS